MEAVCWYHIPVSRILEHSVRVIFTDVMAIMRCFHRFCTILCESQRERGVRGVGFVRSMIRCMYYSAIQMEKRSTLVVRVPMRLIRFVSINCLILC